MPEIDALGRMHACGHSRADHRNMGRGRCTKAACPCLVGPGPGRRIAIPEPKPGGTVTVDGNGLVIGFQPPSKRNKLEDLLERRILLAELPTPTKQFFWARSEGRMYRSDFAYPEAQLLIEVQGGIWARDPGRHNRGSGYQADCERSNLAVILGWKLLAFTEKMIRDGTAVMSIERALIPASQTTNQPCLAM